VRIPLHTHLLRLLICLRRGFETLTLVQEGTVDHTDSLGAAGRYGCVHATCIVRTLAHWKPASHRSGDGHAGDLQWMTAGSGCVHGENFPLVHSDKPNTMRLFQIWINLPPESKMAQPTYVMRWAEEMRFLRGSGGAECQVAVGTLGGVAAGGASPPPDSWGADPAHDVGVFLATLPPGGALTLPPAVVSAANRMAYIVEGPTDAARAAKVTVGGAPAPRGRAAFTLRADAACELRNDNGDGESAQVLVLQGVPIGAPVSQRGPFVMNTQQELNQAFEDYRRTQFGGWPWKEDAVIFARDQARFADIVAADGTKTRVVPPARVADKAEL
jgi:redox-sensitive bicupin YhaK (pirin superfamily)